jgi:hypothetical protein
MKPYLSVCAIYRDEAQYLAEWVEFHRQVGVEKFFLYDNASQDEHLAVLAPHLDDGTVVIHDAGSAPGRGGLQKEMYRRCLADYREASRWIAFLDVDEFLFSPTGEVLPEVLSDYEAFPGVGVNRSWFGSSGHRTKPPGLVIENYIHMMDRRGNSSVKSIVDPTRTVDCVNPHQFIYADGLAVDENKDEIDGVFSRTYTFARLRVNHYYTKSEEECRERKQARLKQNPAFKEARPAGDEHRHYNQVADETILRYVPALRAAMKSRAEQPKVR